MDKTYKVLLTCTVSDDDRKAYADNIGIPIDELNDPDEFSDENLIETELSWAAPSLTNLSVDSIEVIETTDTPSLETHAEAFFDIDVFVKDIAQVLINAYDIDSNSAISCEDYSGLDFTSCTHLSCKDAFKREFLDRNTTTLLETALKQCVRLGDQIATEFHDRKENSLIQKFLQRLDNKIENN